jgi:hypothetical protein
MTILRYHPKIFVEIEERHNLGGVERIAKWLGARGYIRAEMSVDGVFLPLSDFDANIHQHGLTPGDPQYVNNFLFSS